MQCETVPSNVSGRWTFLSSASVVGVFVANELTTTYTMEVTYHEGSGLNEVVLGSVVVNNAKGGTFTVSWAVPQNKQLAVRVKSNTANSPKNVVLGLRLQGVI